MNQTSTVSEIPTVHTIQHRQPTDSKNRQAQNNNISKSSESIHQLWSRYVSTDFALMPKAAHAVDTIPVAVSSVMLEGT
jgi:hypothetical protein